MSDGEGEGIVDLSDLLDADLGGRSPANALTALTPSVKHVVEGALLAAGGPLTRDQIMALYPEDERPARADIDAAVDALREDYRDRAIELIEVAGGWRMQVRARVAPWVARLWDEKPARYSRALLETLALIAYRQPITRGEIEDIRGVAVSTHIIKTLSERDWIRVVGHRDVPGRPALFATTRRFLDYFGLRSLNELPPLAEIRDPAFFGEQPAPESANDDQAPANDATRSMAGGLPALPIGDGSETVASDEGAAPPADGDADPDVLSEPPDSGDRPHDHSA